MLDFDKLTWFLGANSRKYRLKIDQRMFISFNKKIRLKNVRLATIPPMESRELARDPAEYFFQDVFQWNLSQESGCYFALSGGLPILLDVDGTRCCCQENLPTARARNCLKSK